jgi:hypothetical protein
MDQIIALLGDMEVAFKTFELMIGFAKDFKSGYK